MDGIIRQGKELGTYMYIYTGGEPLVRKKDLIRLCEKHTDCMFLCLHQRHAHRRGLCRRDAAGEELCPRHQPGGL